MGTACTGGYKGVRAVRPESVAGGGSKGGPPALAGTREYEQSDRNR